MTKRARDVPAAAGPALAAEQRAFVAAARDTRASLFLTGGAGTGKSVALRAAIAAMRARAAPGTLFVTASTGKAALDHEDATTLHRFAGLGVGDEPTDAAVRRVGQSHKMRELLARARWRACETLVIEEISMISAETFDTLHAVACAVRRRPLSVPFGGIRLIMCGDFFQLPPVPNEAQRRARQPARYAFEAAAWARLAPRAVVLRQVHRQSEAPAFIALLNEVRTGHVSAETERALRGRMNAAFASDAAVASVFPLNRDVAALNEQRLRELPGRVHTFRAVDYASSAEDAVLLRDVTALPVLELKVGAQVMLIKNIEVAGEKLANGMVGVVTGVGAGAKPSIHVRFDDVPGASVPIEEAEWEFRDHAACASLEPRIVEINDDGEIVQPPAIDADASAPVRARRTQYPLVLAYAVSAHKSQGQTLTCAVSTCLRSCFEAGQAYVILSRVRRLEQLSLRSLDTTRIRASPKVLAFYAALGA